MRLLLVGDLHANIERAKEINDLAIRQDIDKIIGLGDFGYTFTPDVISAVSAQKIPWYFIDGNHDDHTQLTHDAPEIEEFAHELYYIPRGHVWEWESKTFAAMGGAYSIDKSHRVPYISWWPDEQIQIGDMYRLDENIGSKKVDIFLSHEAPKIAVKHFFKDANREGLSDRAFLEQAYNNYKPKLWIHGHWHYRYEWQSDDTKFIGLGHDYDTIEEQAYILDLKGKK